MLASKRAKIKVPNRLGLTESSFDDLWSILEKAIDYIYEDRVSDLTFEKLYRTVYNLVLRKEGPLLYAKLESYLSKKLDKLRDEQFDGEIQGFKLLKRLMNVWDAQCSCFKLLSDIMIYLDKVYCKPERNSEVYDLFLGLFKKRVIDPLSKEIDQALIEDINDKRTRRVQEFDHFDAWKRIICMMETLIDERDNYYLTHFEPVLLQSTEQYYKDIVGRQEMDSIHLLEFMKGLKSFEFHFDETFLNMDTVSKITTSLEKVLLWNERFGKTLPKLIRQAITLGDVSLFHDVYYLSSEDDYSLKVIQCIENCLTEDANAIHVEQNIKKKTIVAIQWTRAVIDLSNKYQGLIEELLSRSTSNVNGINKNDLQLNGQIVNNILSKFLNQNGKKSIEFISLYLDSCFKVTHDKEEETKVMQDLSTAVKLFNLLADKDIFEMLYQQQLSKRLLQERSSIELEKWMLQRIKDEVGTFFTSRLYGMLRDVSKSLELSHSFKEGSKKNTEVKCLEFKPQVLTSVNWPFKPFSSSDTEFYLPSKLQELKFHFESFYKKQYPERTLRWAYHLCQLEIGFQFEESYHDMSMSLFAATIFLLFEEHDELTTEMIALLTNIPEQELHRQLISLAVAPKTRILKKIPLSKTISPQDKFCINHSFTAPTRSIKVQTVTGLRSSSKNEPNSRPTEDIVEEGRAIEVNAAITRILKKERHLKHKEVMELVAKAVRNRFTLSSSTLKRSLNYLLEKEFIQRDPEDGSIYHYLP